MRYEKVDDVIQLALHMQAARGGLSLADIEARFTVSRRTAMRMRDAVLRNFPQVEEWEEENRTKRWRIPPGTMDRLVAVTVEELASLDLSTHLLERDGRQDVSNHIKTLTAKLGAMQKPEVARRLEPDLEAMLEAEGLAMRPGPRPRTNPDLVEVLRGAIKACRKVRLRYRSRKKRAANDRLVHPYGFLHGHRNYLVAWHEHPKANKLALFGNPPWK